MTQRLELYKCKVCNNLTQVILDGVGELVCCGQPMELLQPHKRDDEFEEKHVPVITVNVSGDELIRVGSVPHPMIEEHFIQFIEVISKDKTCIKLKYLSPGDEPVMHNNTNFETGCAIEFCNIHGLWGNERGENDK